MASIPGARFDITGASGTQGLLSPKASWRAYILPRGGNASQDSTGTLITFDSAAVAGRFVANNWIQAGLLTANLRQVSAVGGNSLSVSGAALTVTTNDRIFLIGNTQPTVSGGSATYTVPNTVIRNRDDNAATIYTNSMVTTDANGLVQFWAATNLYDCIIQDSNQGNQGSIIDLPVGVVEGVSVSTDALFGASVTINGALGVTGWATFGSTVTMNAQLGVTGTAVFGGSVTISGAALISRLGPISGASSGGAFRIVEGSKFPQSGAGIISALGDLPAAGGEVWLPAGTYTIASAITIGSSQSVRGAGKATVLDVAGNSINCFQVVTTGSKNMAIRDLRITDSTAAKTSIGIHLSAGGSINVHQSVFDNIWFDALGVAIRGTDTVSTGGVGLRFSNLDARFCGWGFYGLADAYGQLTFNNCTFANCDQWGVYTGAAQGVLFSGCEIDSSTAGQVQLAAAVGVHFVGCHIENPVSTNPPVVIRPAGTNACKTIDFVGCVIHANGASWCVDVDGSTQGGSRNLNFIGCNFAGAVESAIRTRSTAANTVPGSVINCNLGSGVPLIFDPTNGGAQWYSQYGPMIGGQVQILADGGDPVAGDTSEHVRFYNGIGEHYWGHRMTGTTDTIITGKRLSGDTSARFNLLCDGSLQRGLANVAPTVWFLVGSGSPEGVQGASIGSIWQRTDGGASTSMYVKETGTTSSGWVGK